MWMAERNAARARQGWVIAAHIHSATLRTQSLRRPLPAGDTLPRRLTEAGTPHREGSPRRSLLIAVGSPRRLNGAGTVQLPARGMGLHRTGLLAR